MTGIGNDMNANKIRTYTNTDVKKFATQAAKDALRDLLAKKDLSPQAEKELNELAGNLGSILANDHVLANINLKKGELS